MNLRYISFPFQYIHLVVKCKLVENLCWAVIQKSEIDGLQPPWTAHWRVLSLLKEELHCNPSLVTLNIGGHPIRTWALQQSDIRSTIHRVFSWRGTGFLLCARPMAFARRGIQMNCGQIGRNLRIWWTYGRWRYRWILRRDRSWLLWLNQPICWWVMMDWVV